MMLRFGWESRHFCHPLSGVFRHFCNPLLGVFLHFCHPLLGAFSTAQYRTAQYSYSAELVTVVIKQTNE